MHERIFYRGYSLHDRTPVLIRSGRKEDEDCIRDFTRNTFPWGDYVADAYDGWLKEPGEVLVAEVEGKPVGVTHVVYVSPQEAWFEGIRVAPDFRGRGIGKLLTRVSMELSRQRGCRLARCAIDSRNDASRLLAMGEGFSLVAKIAELKKVVPDDGGSVSDRWGCFRERSRGPGTIARRASGEHVESLWVEAKSHLRYIGWNFRWRLLSRESIADAVASGAMLVAEDPQKRVVAGGCMSELWEESDDPAGPRLVAELSSPFGNREGLEAITEYVLALLREKAQGRAGVVREIYSFCELGNPARGLLETMGFHREAETRGSGPDYDIGIWEIRLA